MSGDKIMAEVYRKISCHDDMQIKYEEEVIKVSFGQENELEIRYPGGICYTKNTTVDDELKKMQDEIEDTFKTVEEYIANMENCPDLVLNDSDIEYKELATYNDVVLAGKELKDGTYEFITWDCVRNAAYYGNYYTDYKKAKEDFAIRSGLIDKKLDFSTRELIEIYRNSEDTLGAGYELTDEQRETINRIEDKIENFIPDFKRELETELDRQEKLIEQTFS